MRSTGGPPLHVRSAILAADVWLDLRQFYRDEGELLAGYLEFTGDGFWVSRVSSHGAVRIRRDTRARLVEMDPSLSEEFIAAHHRREPGWVFLRLFRTPEYLTAHEFSRREYALLWAFGLLDDQFGFAADVAGEYERRFGPDRYSRLMWEEVVERMKQLVPRRPLIYRTVRRLLPAPVRRVLRRLCTV